MSRPSKIGSTDVRDRTIRLSETVGPYGPGAIVDIVGESFMAPTPDRWPSTRLLTQVECPRLTDELRIHQLFSAPSRSESVRASTSGVMLKFERFPAWHFCQTCRRLERLSPARDDGSVPRCRLSGCRGRLVPMRFIALCTTRSHIQDVDWPRWLHKGPVPDRCAAENADLRFRARARGFGLESLMVRCEVCSTDRSLAELDGPRLKAARIGCYARQPWERSGATTSCDGDLVVQQRGATNVHYGDAVSAIDIPDLGSKAEKLEERIRRHRHFEDASAATDEEDRAFFVRRMARDLELDEAVIRGALGSERKVLLADARRQLLRQEFDAFTSIDRDGASGRTFAARRADVAPDEENRAEVALHTVVPSAVLVDRLREVRAAVEFRRYSLDAEPVKFVQGAAHEKRWLPAAEGWGEGLFLKFDAAAVTTWAEDSAVVQRAAQVEANRTLTGFGSRLHEATPAYLALHSIAHMLIQELAFSSGYTAASLRERIYSEDNGDAGIFIFTTTSDFEGTLGGLVRQGEGGRLLRLMLRAIERHAWCANDPVCRESGPQSLQGLNLAACHTCLLVSETSCEASNLLLDRAMVVGNDGVAGLMTPALDALHRQALEAQIPS